MVCRMYNVYYVRMQEAVRREVKEEAGLEFEPQALVCVETQGMSWVRFTFSGTYYIQYIMHVFVCVCMYMYDKLSSIQ